MCAILFLKNTGIKIRFKQNTVYFMNTFVTELTVLSDPTVKQKALAQFSAPKMLFERKRKKKNEWKRTRKRGNQRPRN